MEKVTKNSIIILLNPVSPIVTLLIGWLLSILITEPNKNFPDIINTMIENPKIVIMVILLWLIFTIIYTDQQQEIENLQQSNIVKDTIIKEKDKHLNYSAGIILNRSGDFANFNKYIQFNDILKDFVENNIMVESAQIYKYSIKKNDNKIIIKVEYEASYVYENIDINNLAQTYYELDYSDYNIIKDTVDIYRRLSFDEIKSYREKDALISLFVKEITDLFKKYHSDLTSIEDVSQIENKHFTEYRILTLLIRLTRQLEVTTFDKTNILGEGKQTIENYLLNGKRTGILNSILLMDIFAFKYTRNSHKKNGRVYISFPANIWGNNYINVFSIQILNLDPYVNFTHEIMSLQEDFVKRFSKK